jgi:ATP-dependent RNA helicase RhlE
MWGPRAIDTCFGSYMSFSKLGLSAEIVRAVTAKGYTEPTPIQEQAIPVILEGRDLLAAAQTGTGKTAGFTLPILQLLAPKLDPAREPRPVPVKATANGPILRSSGPSTGHRQPVRALILAPTRELAAQVEDSVQAYGSQLDLVSLAVFGGVNITPQIRRLRSGVDILVATPGRLLDHVQQRTVDLSQVEILVLDEADRMLDMGFIKDIRRILSLLPKQRQNLLFSATFSNEIKALAGTLLHNPAVVEVARRNASAEKIFQQVYRVARTQKAAVLTHLINHHNWYQVLVFTRTKHGADRLAKHLTQNQISAMAIHGNKSQSVRTKTLARFKEGNIQVLVATDIAARGIDINDLPQVVNFDLPDVPEDYVHRIGRTGRAGSTGGALSLVCEDEVKLLKAIERLIARSLPQEVVPGFEPNSRASQQPPVTTEQRATIGEPRRSSGGHPQPASVRQQRPGSQTRGRRSAGGRSSGRS